MHYQNPEGQLTKILAERIRAGTWFGFGEVDIEIAEPLWEGFEEMLPFFFTKQIPDEAVPRHIKDYLVRTGRERGDGKADRGVVSAKAAAVFPFIAFVCGTRRSHQSRPSHDQAISGDEDLLLVCGVGDRSPPHRRCGQQQSSAG